MIFKSILNLLVCVVLMVGISGCFPIETSIKYNKPKTVGSSSTEPIYLSFRDTRGASFYFTLKRVIGSDNNTLTVYWNIPDNEMWSSKEVSTLKLLINERDVVTLNPVKKTKIVSYDVNEGGHQEEIVFQITRDQLIRIANANSVEAELSGKYVIVVGTFNNRNTFKAFKDFLNNG
jgi:hypothetical protein